MGAKNNGFTVYSLSLITVPLSCYTWLIGLYDDTTSGVSSIKTFIGILVIKHDSYRHDWLAVDKCIQRRWSNPPALFDCASELIMSGEISLNQIGEITQTRIYI